MPIFNYFSVNSITSFFPEQMEQAELSLFADLEAKIVQNEAAYNQINNILQSIESLIKNFKQTDSFDINLNIQEKQSDIIILISYLDNMLPSELQVNSIMEDPVLSQQFQKAMKQVYKNVIFCSQHNKDALFNILIIIYNFGVDKIIKHFQYVILQMLIYSGIQFNQLNFNIIKATVNKNIIKQLQIEKQYDSMKQFQIKTFLNQSLVSIIVMMKETRNSTYNIQFQHPYNHIAKIFYHDNYILLKKKVFKITKQQQQYIREVHDMHKLQEKVQAEYFYIQIIAPKTDGDRKQKIFPNNYKNQIDVQFTQRYFNTMGFDFVDNINAKFSKLELAPIQIQTLINYLDKKQQLIIQELENNGLQWIYEKYQGSDENIYIISIVKLLSYVFVNHQFETGIQEMIKGSYNNIKIMFSDLIRDFKKDVFNVLNKQTITQQIIIYLIFKYVYFQVEKDLQIKLDNLQTPYQSELLQVIDDIIAYIYNRLKNKIDEQLKHLNNLKLNQIQTQFINQALQSNDLESIVLPPYYLLNNLYFLVNLFKIDNLIGIQLFRSIQYTIQTEIYEQNQLSSLIRQLNSFYLMYTVFDYECSQFLSTETLKSYSQTLDQIKEYQAQHPSFKIDDYQQYFISTQIYKSIQQQ